jgi:hypothetical protein
MKPVVLSIVPLLLLLATSIQADDGEAIFDPSKTGDDYNVQGEYSGTLTSDGESRKFGLQVIALGDHKFDGVAYHGGLPGDGWKRGDKSLKASGETEAGVTRLTGDNGYAVITDSEAEIYTLDDEKLGTLKKVERKSKTLGMKPPKDASVLFDGKSSTHFQNGKIVLDKLLLADCESKEKLGDHKLHLEFRTPFKSTARGQARGNSGVYIQGRYELQVLDSFGLAGENNECGGIYSISKPKVNACFPPLTWQTYDIDFTAAKYDSDGKKIENARTTIRQNGILIHDDLELPNHTPGKHAEADSPQSLYLQGHGNPVVYRNIWVVQK